MPTPMPTRAEARKSLDAVIRKSRVHLYKPIQIAEILYHDRVYHDVDLNDLETYRNRSKKWRDDVSRPLLGRICTSSARFQDNLFEENAIPPQVIAVLGEENRRTQGAVEAYIYRQFNTKHDQMAEALHVCQTATPENFDVKAFIDSFWQEPGLKRSLDKIYEIVVYALFSALVEEMQLQVTVSVTKDKIGILTAFSAFARKVMCLEPTKLTHTEQAKVFRVGVTNAADRGLDMYSNFVSKMDGIFSMMECEKYLVPVEAGLAAAYFARMEDTDCSMRVAEKIREAQHKLDDHFAKMLGIIGG